MVKMVLGFIPRAGSAGGDVKTNDLRSEHGRQMGIVVRGTVGLRHGWIGFFQVICVIPLIKTIMIDNARLSVIVGKIQVVRLMRKNMA